MCQSGGLPLRPVSNRPRYLLSSLEDKIKDIATSLTPGWLVTLGWIWQGLEPVARIGGLVTIGYTMVWIAMIFVKNLHR